MIERGRLKCGHAARLPSSKVCSDAIPNWNANLPDAVGHRKVINSKTGCIALFAALMATSASVGVMAATPSPNGTDLRRCYLQKPSHDVRYGLRCVPYYGFVRAGDSDTAHAL